MYFQFTFHKSLFTTIKNIPWFGSRNYDTVVPNRVFKLYTIGVKTYASVGV